MAEREDKFLAAIQSDNADVRFAAWRQAGEMDAGVIPQLGKLAAGPTPGVAKAAREALNTIVHSAGKEPGGARRAEVVKRMLELAGPEYNLPVRVLALRLLSHIAGEDAVPAIAKWLAEPDLREEAVFCLERISGDAPIKTLIASYKEAKNDFKPRILAALGHRRAAEAVPLCLAAMRSPDKEIAMAGIKAFGRIGRKPAVVARFPDPAGLSEFQKIDRMDSLLRYADAQREQGNTAEAMKYYKIALDRPEEHWQCAAIIGIGKMGTPEGAATIFPKLKSADRTVRITAEKVWNAMATAAQKG